MGGVRKGGGSRKRRAVAPILAELMLITITLILGASLGGFAFGVMGSYTAPAEVEAQQAVCSSSVTGLSCSVGLLNLGAGSVQTASVCVLKAGGTTMAGSLDSAALSGGGGRATVDCTASGLTMQAGSSVAGSVLLSNGAEVYFIAT